MAWVLMNRSVPALEGVFERELYTCRKARREQAAAPIVFRRLAMLRSDRLDGRVWQRSKPLK